MPEDDATFLADDCLLCGVTPKLIVREADGTCRPCCLHNVKRYFIASNGKGAAK
jgi:hypothetical protein